MPFFINTLTFIAANSAALVANGEIRDYSLMEPKIRQYKHLIAVDGGLRHCDAMKITPELIVGDCDSTSTELLNKYAHVPIQRHPCDKDFTDTELAILQVNSERITLFAALGDRTDHSIGNLHLLRRYPHKLFIETETEIIFAITGTTTIECRPGQTIAFLPLGPVSGITSQGLKWELNNATFDQTFMSISNICLSEKITLSIAVGDLICVIQK